MKSGEAVTARVVLSVVAAGAAAMHMIFPRFIPDVITAGLLALAALPWLSSIIKSVEITGIGRLELLEQKQESLRREVDALRFLMTGFVTDWELLHLRKLAADGEFTYERGADRADRFVNEIIRLRDFGLVKKLVDYSLWDIPLKGNLKQYVALTPRGHAYLRLRSQIEVQSSDVVTAQRE